MDRVSEAIVECSATTMCKPLADRTDPHAAKGFRSYWTINRETVGERFLGVAYATGRADRGLMLNVCPFCKGAPGHFERTYPPDTHSHLNRRPKRAIFHG